MNLKEFFAALTGLMAIVFIVYPLIYWLKHPHLSEMEIFLRVGWKTMLVAVVLTIICSLLNQKNS